MAHTYEAHETLQGDAAEDQRQVAQLPIEQWARQGGNQGKGGGGQEGQLAADTDFPCMSLFSSGSAVGPPNQDDLTA
eukprot:1142302-Pelagomonas_calceolata.AAC.3